MGIFSDKESSMNTTSLITRFAPIALLLSLCLPAPAAEDVATHPALAASGVKGGLVVLLGCGDGRSAVALRGGEAFLVQALDTSAQKVAAARRHIASIGACGAVTARAFDGRRLPFVDNTVNVLVADDPFAVPAEEMLRVLCPGGVLCTRQGQKWNTRAKPRPDTLDEWTHYQHDPQGTMVGRDKVVGPPRRIQWMGGPKWLRNHDFMSSMNAMVSSGGRIFYIIDEGLRAHVFLPARWTLIARDAFNGTILWKRPLKDWHPTNWPLKSGPGDMPRRLVAVGDRVFVTLGYRQPVTALDAVTGQTVRTYDQTRSTDEILFSDGALYLAVEPDKPPVEYRAQGASYGEIGRANSGWGWSRQKPERTVLAVDARSGKTLWQHKDHVAPLTLTVGADRVFFFDGERMIALDRSSGQRRWASDSPGKVIIRPATGAAARVVCRDDVLVICHSTQTAAFSAKDGKLLWQGRTLPSGHHCPNDLFVIDNLVWSAHTGVPQKQGTHFVGLDLHTGEAKQDLVAENLPAFPMHPRCYPSRATERFIMTAGMGTEFYAPGSRTVDINHVVRGSCIYGVMPCNGLLYKPPDSCACYYMSKLEYFCALAPADEAPAEPPPSDEQRLEKGPAYVRAAGAPEPAAAGDWPMYRCDNSRSGACATGVPAKLKQAWRAELGGRLTQPVVAGGRVYVAAIDAHTLYALDAATGKPIWNFLAGGRIDSPPTVTGQTLIFGSADGWVYCLAAEDGSLAWRRLVAPQDRQIVAMQQVESLWPLHGSVLVHKGAVYALAGRNMFFDGGMRLVRIEAATGRMLSQTVLNELDPNTGKNLQTLIVHKSMPVANPDILSCDGKRVYMGAQRFNLEGKRLEIASISAKSATPPSDSEHLFCPTGFLDDLWFHRTYWTYGVNFPEGWAEYNIAQKRAPSGRIMAIGKSRAYGYRADGLGNTLLPTPRYRLYAAELGEQEDAQTEGGGQGAATKDGRKAARKGEGKKKAPKTNRIDGGAIAGKHKVCWQIESPPLLVNAMALAGENLIVAGPPDVADESKMLGFLPGADDEVNRSLQAQEDAWRGGRGALLWVVSADDGKKLAQYKLQALPIWDGLAAAAGRLFVSLQDGSVVCWGGQ